MKHATEQYYINKIAALESELAYYRNPCMLCGSDSWSTYICDDCVKETNFIENDDNESVLLEHTDIYLTGHHIDHCAGEYCTLHNRSNHSMRSFPQHWRGDRGVMERVCPHGIGHPDPDEYKLFINEWEGVHGCDGCCSK